MSRFIQIVEVGPRDGLQNEKTVLEPAVRADFVQRLEAAGAKRIEAVSFVHPKYVPQMAGAEEVMAALPRTEGRSRIGLVLNGKGYDRALGTAVDEVNVAMSATDGFGLKNQSLSVDQQVQMLSEIVTGRANAEGAPGATPRLSATLSCVWGCPFDGEVSVQQVGDLVARIAALGVEEIALADTIGVGDPWSGRARRGERAGCVALLLCPRGRGQRAGRGADGARRRPLPAQRAPSRRARGGRALARARRDDPARARR